MGDGVPSEAGIVLLNRKRNDKKKEMEERTKESKKYNITYICIK